VFGNSDWDIRQSVAIVYKCKVIGEEIQPEDDAANTLRFDLKDLPELAFDHKEILDLVIK